MTQRGNQRLFTLTQASMIDSLPDPEWLIEGVLPAGSLGVLYGRPGVGKTFVALDWATHVVRGASWLDHRVQCGMVVYLSTEGVGGLKYRVKACVLQDNASFDDLEQLWFITEGVNLTDGGDVERLKRSIRLAIGDGNVTLIIVDTLARSFGGQDENAAGPMNALVAACDALRSEHGAAVLIVHHSGHEKKRERGSSVLRGAADTMIRVEATGVRNLKLVCDKQKDSEPFAPIPLRLQPVQLPNGRSSCAVVTVKGRQSELMSGLRVSARNQLQVLASIGNAGATNKTWKSESSKAGISGSTFKRNLTVLKKLRLVESAQGRGMPYIISAAGRNVLKERNGPSPDEPDDNRAHLEAA